jgi:hypothetical protein
MQNIKYGVLVCGLVGLIGCFLPLVSEGGLSFSVWDLHSANMGQTILTMLGYIVGIGMGVLGLKAGLARWQAVVAAVGFALALLKIRSGGGLFDMLTHGAIGGKLMWLAAVVGLVSAIVSAVKPAPATK